MIVDVNVGYDLIERVTVSCDSPDIAIDMTLGGAGVTAHDQLTEASRSLPNQHPIAAITNLGTTLSGLSGDISIVQSDLAAHKIATNPHNITPAGIGALSVVAHDSSLNGDGTAQSPLKHNPIYAEVTTLADVSVVEITQDINGNPFSVKNGETIEIISSVSAWVNQGNDRLNFRINDIKTSEYLYLSNTFTSFFTFLSLYKAGSFTFRINLINNRVYAYTINNIKIDDKNWLSYQIYAFQLSTNITEITSLKFFTSSGLANIPAGTRIIVKKY